MPEIKIKHVVSFSSEDKVHKAENLMKPETYRKWKCATPGEKNATIVLQFEKATQIHSIDIGNESSAFVEVLVGRSSDSLNDFQVLLLASSFMSPLESRNGEHANRVRMFGPEKLSQNVKDEKWDCVQIVCTQPFNKTISYGLTFIKFHSLPEKNEEQPKSSEAKAAPVKLGAFKIRYEDDEDSLPSVGSWFGKKKTESSGITTSSDNSKHVPSYASAILSSTNNANERSLNSTPKRKPDENSNASQEPPTKKPATSALNKDYIVFKDVLNPNQENKKTVSTNGNLKKDLKTLESKKTPAGNTSHSDESSTSNKKVKVKKKVPLGKIMENVVIVLSGFVNPLRSELRDKALEMGAKYKGDWDSSCTHLICAFLNTPKFTQVNKLGGKIVSKNWIIDCYKKKQLLPWKKFVLSRVTSDSSDEAKFTEESEESDSSEEEYVVGKKKNTKSKIANASSKKNSPAKKTDLSLSKKEDDSSTLSKNVPSSSLNESNNGNSLSPSLNVLSGSKDESETEDEEALQDYMAATDVDSVDNNSGGDTEDEIRKIEKKAQRKAFGSPSRKKSSKIDSVLSEKPDITDMPLPPLPNLFKQKHFFLYGKFTSPEQHGLCRYITAYNGIVDGYMSSSTKYVITDEKWDQNFDDALNENEDLIFVKSTWIYKCHEAVKLVPYQPYIITPD